MFRDVAMDSEMTLKALMKTMLRLRTITTVFTREVRQTHSHRYHTIYLFVSEDER